jgi:hypothetical protein
MLPAINALLVDLPSPAELDELTPKLHEVKRILQAASEAGRQLTDEQRAAVVRRLERGLSAWRTKKKSSSDYNKLSGLNEIARTLESALRGLHVALENRLVTNADELIKTIVSSLIGTGSILEIPPRQLELINQVTEAVLARITADKLTPPLRRSITDDALESLTDEALEELPVEDNVLACTRRLHSAIIRFAKSFGLATVDIERKQLSAMVAELSLLVDRYRQLEMVTYDVCELVHEHRLIDPSQLSEPNRNFLDYLFPSEIITLEPSAEMRGAWREAALERQIKSDMEDTLRETIRLHPVANALMAQFAESKDMKIYDEARLMVLPQARAKLELRMAHDIFNKASDELEKKDIIHRYPVEISDDLSNRVQSGDEESARRIAQAQARVLMQQFVPEVFQQNINVEP